MFATAKSAAAFAGALATTVEQALLELVQTSEAPEFKPLQALLRE